MSLLKHSKRKIYNKKKNRIYEWNVQHFTFNNFPVQIFLKAIFTKIFIIPFHLMGFEFTRSFFATVDFGYHKILRVHGKIFENPTETTYLKIFEKSFA